MRACFALTMLFVVGLATACSGSGETSEALSDTQDSVFATTSTLNLESTTTADEDQSRSTTEPAASEQLASAPADVPDSPVYSHDILPILERSCASCHTAGQAGSGGLELSGAADAVEHASEIKLVTEARVMPPWPASAESVSFVGDMSLTEDEIRTLSKWVDDGAPIDVAAETPITSSLAPSILPDPEIVMTSAAGPYKGSSDNRDDYRCLIFEPGNTEKEWIRAAQFIPDQTEVVHHGIITLATAELRDQADWLDGLTPGPGWTCYGGNGLQANEGGSVFRVGGWAPGAQPSRQPEGYAIPLEPGSFFVVQIHYHYDDDATPADESQYVLDLASDDEIAANGGDFKPLAGARYLGPAEIPCYAGDTHPLCDRDAAVERVKSLYGEFIGGLPNYFLWSCNSTVLDYADMTDGDAWSTCDLPVTNPGRVVALTAHMHELGSTIRLTLNPDTPEEQVLLDIPDWDFEWQLGYRPVDDLIIDRDDVIRIDCSWNRERAPYQAVGYILWADGTGDEMCFSTITTAPLE